MLVGSFVPVVLGDDLPVAMTVMMVETKCIVLYEPRWFSYQDNNNERC